MRLRLYSRKSSIVKGFPGQEVRCFVSRAAVEGCMESHPLLDSPIPSKTQLIMGTVLSICIAPPASRGQGIETLFEGK